MLMGPLSQEGYLVPDGPVPARTEGMAYTHAHHSLGKVSVLKREFPRKGKLTTFLFVLTGSKQNHVVPSPQN